MWISWLTEAACSSIVHYSSPGTISKIAVGQASSSYSTQSKYGLYQSQYIHHVSLKKLFPDTLYTYNVGGSESTSAADVVFSDNIFFKTMPLTGVESPFRLAIIGDLGMTASSVATMEGVMSSSEVSDLAQEAFPSIVMIVGDLSYADSNGTM